MRTFQTETLPETWARHANPLSVWSRMSCLPLLLLAIWSRSWLGYWALLFVALAAFWTWYNPRIFSAPETTNSWAAKGTFGERIFLQRKKFPVPRHHQLAAYILTAVSAFGVLIVAYGLIMLDGWTVILGLFIAIGAKLWFVDRMVWLFEDMKASREIYSSWLRS